MFFSLMVIQVATNFGLIDRTYVSDIPGAQKDSETQWQRFEREVERLKAEADEGVVYKVLYLGRHGQGVHNVAEQRYGRAEWDVSPRLSFDVQFAFPFDIHLSHIFLSPSLSPSSNIPPCFSQRSTRPSTHCMNALNSRNPPFQRYYASLEGDAHGHWADAHLTPLGVTQALAVHAFWAHQLGARARTPAPQSYYASPLHRCLETANRTFQGLDLPAGRPYRPVVKELLREVLGVVSKNLVALFPPPPTKPPLSRAPAEKCPQLGILLAQRREGATDSEIYYSAYLRPTLPPLVPARRVPQLRFRSRDKRGG